MCSSSSITKAGYCQLASFNPFENSGQQNMCSGLGDGSCNIPVFVGLSFAGLHAT
jgi:hypothetical protein